MGFIFLNFSKGEMDPSVAYGSMLITCVAVFMHFAKTEVEHSLHVAYFCISLQDVYSSSLLLHFIIAYWDKSTIGVSNNLADTLRTRMKYIHPHCQYEGNKSFDQPLFQPSS